MQTLLLLAGGHSPLPNISANGLTNITPQAGCGFPFEANALGNNATKPSTVTAWKPTPVCMPPTQSQFSVPIEAAGPPPQTPSITPEGSDNSPLMPTKPINPATRTTPIFGGARKLFVRSKTNKGRASRLQGRAECRCPRLPSGQLPLQHQQGPPPIRPSHPVPG